VEVGILRLAETHFILFLGIVEMGAEYHKEGAKK
jgi:hypothetical protein